jgi:hypothetical protein
MCQVRLAVEAQLDPALTRKQRLRLLAKPARIIGYRQWRNRLARISHRKAALRRLREMGFCLSRLPSCQVRL